MPLLKIEWSDPLSAWAVWHITETEADLSGAEACPDDITNPIKRIEWQAGRMLVQHLSEEAGLKFSGIRKDDRGKPFLKKLPHHISLSHSFPYVAAQLSAGHAVGIDIEQPREKLLTIAHRVYSPAELADAGQDLVKNCVYWCAKEALYKIYGKKGMSFIENLRIAPFVLDQQGVLAGTIDMPGTRQEIFLRYEVTSAYVVVSTQHVG